MTTHLKGDKTRFLPFNLDTENPINPNGHKTAYLWQDILQPQTLMDLIDNYLHVQKKEEKDFDKKTNQIKVSEYEEFVFPRFHQLDVVRKLLHAVKQEGVGQTYLVQHSAGSGKSNSIAWLSHQLTSLFMKESDNERLFDSIIVVTDRKILDRQLQNTITQFKQIDGVVHPIDKNSQQLKEKLEQGKSIIITTLQKFPIIYESIAHIPGKNFAVIVDEAHSSQSGESSKHMKQVLAANLEKAESEDHVEFDVEDEALKEIRIRGKQPNISYFAFTATPKSKTLELFGRKDENGKHRAFHNYTMRQAIEEGFILDILQNYTTFKRYFKLVKAVKEDKEYEKKKAIRLLTSYVDLQPHAIEMKTRIMLDHFLEKTVNAIQGKGRAMVVTRSRLHAVKYFHAFQKIMAEEAPLFKPLVAFSGTVIDPDTFAEYTENNLNNLGPKIKIEDAFKTPDYRILIVAEKFQTGFDEPLLQTMYVDKKLEGLHAVQTLSRLNRTYRGKDDAVILDFVNEAEDIETAFQPYYQKTIVEEGVDPNRLYNLQTQLETYDIYTQDDIQRFAEIFYNPNEPKEKYQPILDIAVHRFMQIEENDREDFRTILQKYIRLYSYISQIITFEDISLEKLYAYARNLNRKLPKRENNIPFEIQDSVDLDSFRIQKTFEGKLKLQKEDGVVIGPGNNGSRPVEEEKDILSNIIKALNDLYGVNLTEEDKVDMERLLRKLYADEELKAAMTADNTLQNKKEKFDRVTDKHLTDYAHSRLEFYKKMTEPRVSRYIKDSWFVGYRKDLTARNAQFA